MYMYMQAIQQPLTYLSRDDERHVDTFFPFRFFHFLQSEDISICKHTHSRPILEIIVLSNDKIVRGKAEYDLHHCVYNYFLCLIQLILIIA